MSLQRPRRVESLVAGQALDSAGGLRRRRLLGAHLQCRLDPFLQLDVLEAALAAGGLESSQPQCGMESLCLVQQGALHLRGVDERLLRAGELHWTRAGRGLLQAAAAAKPGALSALQIGLNLAARDKRLSPCTRLFAADEIPLLQSAGLQLRLLAGCLGGRSAPLQRQQQGLLIAEVELQPGALFEQPLPESHNAMVYAMRGDLGFESGCLVPAERLAVLANEAGADGLRLRAGPRGARLLLLAARPLGEPLACHGELVMNHGVELLQAMRELEQGVFAGPA